MGVASRMGKRTWAALAAAAGLVAAVTAYACADPLENPTWDLAKDYYDTGGNGAMLTPGNDTRVNLLLLLADRRGAVVRDPRAKQEGPPVILFPWALMADAAEPPSGEASPYQWQTATRCQSNAAGAAAFIRAVRSSTRVPEEEKQRLAAARAALAPDCSAEVPRPDVAGLSTPAGRAFAAYLAGAADFYSGRFDAARGSFAGLSDAPEPWLRESGLYMVARTELNRAQQLSFDEYGALAEPEQRDQKAIAAARAAFEAYLRAYPKGSYAASARGLTRRVAWLKGDDAELAAAFDRQLARPGPVDGAGTALALTNEIDLALLGSGDAKAARDPMLVAVADLRRMRCSAEAAECGPRIGRAELERQAPLFAKDRALFDYLRAAEAYSVRRQPREVLALIPDAARQRSFSYVEFSRQMLRGLALEATGDPATRVFWLSLFEGAMQPYQRGAVELALAMHEERSGGLMRIFAPDSRVRHPVIRQLLLEHVAGPDLLRRQARDAAAPRQEREVALYMLLGKELGRGFYREFLNDVALVPKDVPQESYYDSASSYDARSNPNLQRPPLSRFLPAARVGEIGCPALLATVRQLADAPRAVRPRLCLAEYVRTNGFDDFEVDWRMRGRGLATTKPQFPGTPYQRLEVYKTVIADPAATDDDRALALNRAVRCYEPTGSNSCGGIEVDLATRRAWFARLKRDYPKSRWAQSLRYYW
ncbi:MAG TPA: hypothetical protein VF662_03910 [Allosphingosinicella sp.]|jgi:hypothetical protein